MSEQQSSLSADLSHSEGDLALYESLKQELATLKKQEVELLAEQTMAKAKYRAGHPTAVIFSVKPPAADLRKCLVEDGLSRNAYIVQTTDLAAYVMDENERIIEANKAFCQLTGYSMEEVLSGELTLSRLSTPDSIGKDRTAIASLADRLVSVPFEGVRFSKDGRRLPVAITVRVLSDEPFTCLAFLLDLSDLRLLEDSLRERNLIFTAIVEEMPHLVFVANGEGETRFFNKRFYELTGSSARDDEGRSLLKHMPAEDREKFSAGFKKAGERGGGFEGEFRLQASDGDYYWHTFRILPLQYINGLLNLAIPNSLDEEAFKAYSSEHSRLWIGTATDIDKRKRLMDEVLESAHAFQSLANQIPQIVWTAGADGRLDFFNERWYAFSGHSREHKLGMDFALFIHPDDRKEYMRLWKSSVKTGDAFECEFRLRDFGPESSGEKFSYNRYLARAVALRNYRGEVAQWIGTWTSIE